MTIRINTEAAIMLLKEQVRKKGFGHVYKPLKGGACVYQHHDKPSCLIGHALYEAGAPIEALKGLDLCVPIIDSQDALDFLSGHGVVIDPEAAKIFAIAQIAQDTFTAWGVAVDYALNTYKASLDK